MKMLKPYLIGTAVILALSVMLFISYSKSNNDDIGWIKDFSFDETQIHDISFQFLNPCPSIPVKIGSKTVRLEFDTGNGMGIFITTALKDKVDYEVTGTITELNADGTYRGDGKAILLKRMSIFGKDYYDIASSITDWRMFGFFKINGTIGLKYFDHKVIALDYKNKKITLSDKAIDYSKLQNMNYTILPLIKSDLKNEQDLLFFEGEVNGEKSTIYLDTGSSRSFYNLENAGNKLAVKLGEKAYTFPCKKMKYGDIGFSDSFRYPLKLAINSDLLKANHIVIIIDKLQNNLIISQN